MPGSDLYVNQKNYVDGDDKPVGAFIGQRLLATNGNAWEWSGTGWYPIKLGGASSSSSAHPDPALSIAEGEIAGHSHINKFGRARNLQKTELPVDITGISNTLYVPPTAARIHQIASTNVADAGTVVSSGTLTTVSTHHTEFIDSGATFISDGVAVGDAVLNDTAFDHSCVESITSETELVLVGYHDGNTSSIGDAYRIVTPASTGVSVVHITKGIGSDGYFAGEFIVLNGTTNVPTVNEYWRINRMHADGVGNGASESNVGTLTATADTDGTITCLIFIGVGQTQMAFDTVPRGKVGYITNYYGSLFMPAKTLSATASIAMYFRKFITANGTGKIVEHTMDIAIDGSSNVPHVFNPYKAVKELTDVWLSVRELSDDSTWLSAGFDMVEVDSGHS